MRPEDLKDSISKITIPNAVEGRLLENCTRLKAKSFNFRKLTRVAVACVLAIGLLLGVPYFSRNLVGNNELVLGNSPLVFKAAALTDDNIYVLEDIAAGADIYLGKYVAVMNSLPGFPLHLSYPGTAIELNVDRGQFLLWDTAIRFSDGNFTTSGKGPGSGGIDFVGNTYTMDDQGWIFWSPLAEGIVESATIDYRIREGNHIIGYGVIGISSKDGYYSAKLLLSAGFPKVDGKYQKVTENKLQEMREEIVEKNH